MAREYDHLFKLLIIGDSDYSAVFLGSVGKSSLLLRFSDNTFSGETRSTQDYRDNGLILQQLVYYRGTHGVIVVYDVSSGESFANVKRWLHEIDQNCDVVNRILVGNKDDDPDRKVVLTQDAQRFAEQMGIQKNKLKRQQNNRQRQSNYRNKEVEGLAARIILYMQSVKTAKKQKIDHEIPQSLELGQNFALQLSNEVLFLYYQMSVKLEKQRRKSDQKNSVSFTFQRQNDFLVFDKLKLLTQKSLREIVTKGEIFQSQIQKCSAVGTKVLHSQSILTEDEIEERNNKKRCPVPNADIFMMLKLKNETDVWKRDVDRLTDGPKVDISMMMN
ncbi:hypothetical protein KUTeg_010457 [Tegillarca granosa]|uniref:Uncharacterized protein n=1 Tax=Tegillarca granosa TaxID=220873 RepID=A0ABQ9F6T0_TEGGR|nr:hypothetical protein KUTeg_010457 [Tegillarca granosa]